MIGFAMILPLLPFYALELEASPIVIGLIISSFSVAQLLSAPIWGRLSDRSGRRPALLIGLCASAMAFMVFGFANSVGLLFASRIIQGAGGGTTGVAQAYVADTVPAEDRTRALGWLSAASSAGVMIGPMIGSFAAYWGQAAPGLVAAMLCLINVVFAWFWLPESKQAGQGPPIGARRPLLKAAAGIIRHPGGTIPRFIWIYSIGMFAFASLTSVLSLYLGAEFGFTEKSIGYVFLYVGLLSLLMRSVCLDPIVRRTGETWAMRLGGVTLVLGFATYPLVGSLPLLAAIIPLVPIGSALIFPSTTALMSRASERAAYGETLGIAQTYAGFARMLAPIMATYAFQRWGHGAPFWIASGCAVILCALAFRIQPVSGLENPKNKEP